MTSKTGEFDGAIFNDIEVGRLALRTFAFRNWLPEEEHTFDSISLNRNCWGDGTCKAECLYYHCFAPNEPRTPPYQHCTCGAYGYLSLDELKRQYRPHARKIIAVIAVEGKTIIGTKGLRTQYARVIAYWIPFWRRHAREVAAQQFKDARRYRRPGVMARAYGLPLRLKDVAT